MAEINNARVYPCSYERLYRPNATWKARLLFWAGAKRVPFEKVDDRIDAPSLKAAIRTLDSLLRNEEKKGWNIRRVSLNVGGKWLTRSEAIMRTYSNINAVLERE